VSLGHLNSQSPLLSVFRLLHPLSYLQHVSHPSEADYRVSEQIIFLRCGVVSPTPNPPAWRTRVSLFVCVIPLDLSGMGGPTSSIRYLQHSSRVHVITQAPPLRQSRDTFRGIVKN
jgi:hypothetical protein